MAENPVIIALNFTEKSKALKVVEKLRPFVDRFKIGLPLFVRYGKSIVEEAKKYDARIFLDLKLHDIPSVIDQTIQNIVELDIEFLTIHLQGGLTLARTVTGYSSAIKLLGVTILTSIAPSEFESIYGVSLNESVIKLADIAHRTGFFGIVCSGHESKKIKTLFPRLRTVVPGIRLNGNKSDQSRVSTPCKALQNGADYIVVGRDITHHANITDRMKQYLEEIEQCGYL